MKNNSNPQFDMDIAMIETNFDFIPWSTINNKTILITGASGMIGSFLIDMLMYRNEKYDANTHIFALSRNREKLEARFKQYASDKRLTLIEQDITAPIKLNETNIDYIIHAASNTHPIEYATKPIETITTNVVGLQNVLDLAIRQKNCRVMVLSSVEIYGNNNQDIDYFDEKSCGYIDCNTLRAGYPESKRLSEAMLQAYISEKDIDGVIARLCRVYGPGVAKDDSKALTQFFRNAVEKKDIVLKSKGNQFFSYVYVTDACSAILKILLEGECGEAYNVADAASDITLKELAELIARISGTKVIFELPVEGEAKGYSTANRAVLDSSKLKKLGWKACYSIEDGIRTTIDRIIKEKEQ